MTTYTTRCEAIQHEIIDPIEKAENINACEVFNINAIAYQVLGDHSQGYARRVDTDTFWAIVDSCKRGNPDEGESKPVNWCIVWRYHEPGVDPAEFDWDGSSLIDGPYTIVTHDTALLTRADPMAHGNTSMMRRSSGPKTLPPTLTLKMSC